MAGRDYIEFNCRAVVRPYNDLLFQLDFVYSKYEHKITERF
jgi:hypothetical protein